MAKPFERTVGRPRGAKSLLHSAFTRALLEDFAQHGAHAIAICRVEEPSKYLKIIASILPRELVYENATHDLTDTELEAMITHYRAQMLEAPVEQPLLIEHDNVRERETLSSRNSEASSKPAGAPEA
jgi:hypothetical protein